MSYISYLSNRLEILLPLQHNFHEQLCSNNCNLLWRIGELDLELLACRSEERISPSSLDLIWQHISAIYLIDLASNLCFPTDQGSNPREVIFQSCRSGKSFLGYLGNPSHWLALESWHHLSSIFEWICIFLFSLQSYIHIIMKGQHIICFSDSPVTYCLLWHVFRVILGHLFG